MDRKKENSTCAPASREVLVAWLVLICIACLVFKETPVEGGTGVRAWWDDWSLQQLKKELHDLNYSLFLSVTIYTFAVGN